MRQRYREALSSQGQTRQINAMLEQRVAERTAQLKAANDAKSVFLANMSHEIRTPLNVIVGLTELLREEARDPRQKRRLEQLSESSQHLIGIINDILDISKIEAGQLVLDRSAFRLGSVTERVLRLLGNHARDKGLRFSTRIAREVVDLPLEGDPLRLSQVLINLCSNAIKFTDHGQIDLSVSQVASTCSSVTLRFCVTDTGCGIDLADQGQLFQPFLQIDPSSTRRHGGTGLGLAISQHLIHMMGGRIALKSALGLGSAFSFEITLPRATEHSVELGGNQLPVGGVRFPGCRVLLAEDHPLSQEILLEMLGKLGCEADVAYDGQLAVAYAGRQPYDLILMDMQMPRMNGVTAARAIRRLPGYTQTPIIALTANAFAEDRERCLAAGMSAHLSKPVTLAHLAAVLMHWLPEHSTVPTRHADASAAAQGPAPGAIPDLEIDQAWQGTPEERTAFAALLRRFILASTDEVGMLRTCLEHHDLKTASTIVHNLKGSAGLVGAKRVAQLASNLERSLKAAPAPHPGQVQAGVLVLEQALGRLRENPCLGGS